MTTHAKKEYGWINVTCLIKRLLVERHTIFSYYNQIFFYSTLITAHIDNIQQIYRLEKCVACNKDDSQSRNPGLHLILNSTRINMNFSNTE